MHPYPCPGAMKLRKRRKGDNVKSLSACGEGFRVGLRPYSLNASLAKS